MVTTYRDNPELTGSREKKEMQKDSPVLHHFGEMVRSYFHGKIIKTVDLDPEEVYLFGFHPHGIMPFTCFWLRCSEEWEKLFPGVTFSTLTASVMHLIPVMRDVLQWMGGREVSKEAIQLALRSKRSCLLIPGGQAEMMESRSCLDEIVLVTKHIGFIRLAMQENVKLVPVLSIGEVDLMDNVQMPKVQRWFLQRIGFAAPFSPYGVWYLPIPNPKPVSVIVGTPITVPHVAEPSLTEIYDVLYEYMCGLNSIFDANEEVCQQGLPNRTLKFLDFQGKKRELSEFPVYLKDMACQKQAQGQAKEGHKSSNSRHLPRTPQAVDSKQPVIRRSARKTKNR